MRPEAGTHQRDCFVGAMTKIATMCEFMYFVRAQKTIYDNSSGVQTLWFDGPLCCLNTYCLDPFYIPIYSHFPFRSSWTFLDWSSLQRWKKDILKQQCSHENTQILNFKQKYKCHQNIIGHYLSFIKKKWLYPKA